MAIKPLIEAMFPFRYCKRLIVASLLCLQMGNAQAQEMNLPAYDHVRMHFGFIIAYNSTNFFVQPIANLSSHFSDTIKGIYSKPMGGFDLGIVAELKISKYLKLRFVPDLSFATRTLTYSVLSPVDT